ncbi:MAG: helicase C-terminal domain-containing protein [Xenococcaceae cyanobacterium]
MIGEDQGRIFEVGFNIGILAYLEQNQLAQKWVQFYRRDLQQLKFRQILQRLITRASAISSLDKQIIANQSQFLLLRGFLGGLNFFREYIKSTGWDEPRRLRKLEVLYYQCRFADDNSINTYSKGNHTSYSEILAQFGDYVKKINKDEIEIYLRRYTQKGEFLNADTLILLRYKQKYRILAVDTSVFSFKSEQDITNLEFVELIKRQLIREINYLRSKSVFSHLRIDTGKDSDLDFLFHPGLKQYFTAFKYEDKESSKLIQAGGYAHSFFGFLQQAGILPDEAKLVVSVVGYSDRSPSTMTVGRENLNLLDTCYQIYKYDSSKEDINTARKEVLNIIKRQGYRSFDNGRKFVNFLLEIPVNQTTVVSHQERLEDFCNTVGKIPEDLAAKLKLSPGLDLRNAHAELIKKTLVSDNTYIFLTGNPGIGKTTAIAEFLKEHIEEGFLFFYVSPRKQVNLDIIDKFKSTETGRICDNRLFFLNTNANLIKDNGNQYTVQYLSSQHQSYFKKKSVHFLDAREEIKLRGKHPSQLQRKTEDVIQSVPQGSKGVMASICQSIYALIDEQMSNQIVASVSIQSLKKTRTGDTLNHFGNIFKGAYNKKTGVNSQRMREISKRIRHLFIMIDEITGDDSGVEFLNRIRDILRTYGLVNEQHTFNTKVIVADASIVDKDVIKQHLSDTSPEPDKIFFRKAQSAGVTLSLQHFHFKGLNAIAINANSYPASSLDITYKVVVNSYQFKEKEGLKNLNYDLVKISQQEIIQDINAIWKQGGQLLVYIQDKQRLQQLIKQLREIRVEFSKNQDYLEVHANLSEKERQEIQEYKNQVKIIFMTASGSRGLSFPKVKHILVDIPRFQVEKNLMEIIQVIYRGRGDSQLDRQNKQLIFYLSERAVYYDNEPQISLQESILNILNILLILKASMMTRIVGAGRLGRDNFLMIPIGGKSVSAAGETFSSQMVNLLRQVKQEQKVKPSDYRLRKIYTKLKELLGEADFILKHPDSAKETPKLSYLSLQERLNRQCLQVINHDLDRLLKFGDLETGYLCGSLIIVPTADRSIEETYKIQLDKLVNLSGELLNNLLAISLSSDYQENLRFATSNAIDLLNKLREQNDKSQRLEQNSQRLDQYYALPLFTFLNGKGMKEYFAEGEEAEEAKFRYILEIYVRSLYSADNMLPIGDRYEDFPFVVFSSYSLEEVRDKIFTDKYLLNSNELNVLNLILSKET